MKKSFISKLIRIIPIYWIMSTLLVLALAVFRDGCFESTVVVLLSLILLKVSQTDQIANDISEEK